MSSRIEVGSYAEYFQKVDVEDANISERAKGIDQSDGEVAKVDASSKEVFKTTNKEIASAAAMSARTDAAVAESKDYIDQRAPIIQSQESQAKKNEEDVIVIVEDRSGIMAFFLRAINFAQSASQNCCRCLKYSTVVVVAGGAGAMVTGLATKGNVFYAVGGGFGGAIIGVGLTACWYRWQKIRC